MVKIFETRRKEIVEHLLLFIADDPRSGLPGKNSHFRASLKNATRGIVFTMLSERNFRIELLFFFCAITLGVILRIDRMEWGLVLLNGFLVLALEAKNTSLELSVDLITKEYHYGAKSSKDSASGAVLLCAVASLFTGSLVFGPRLLDIARVMLSVLGGSQ